MLKRNQFGGDIGGPLSIPRLYNGRNRTFFFFDYEGLRQVAGQVFNAGHSDENYRKLDIVDEIRRHLNRGKVKFVHRAEDPRDYKVSFERIRAELDFVPGMKVSDGIVEIIAGLDTGLTQDLFQ